MNYGLTKVNVQRMVYELAIKNNKNIPESWNKNKSTGRDWLYGFMKRHTNLSLRKPEACSLSRATSFNKHAVEEFFLKLKEVYSRNSSFADGSRLYNLAETATSTVQNPNNIITLKGVKQVAQVTSAERGTLVTTCCIINALGHALPPVMVFPRTHFKQYMINEAPPGTLGLAQPTGWMTSVLFYDVIKHFVKYTNASNNNPALLILDNHESHLSIPVIDYAKEHGITLLTIHPHCSHKLQPLDVSIYGPFKSYYHAAMISRLQQKPGVPLTIYDIAALVKVAHKKAMTPTNIIAGFKKTRIFPLDEHVFQEYDFAPSLVTDRSLENECKIANDENTIEQESAAITVEQEQEQQNKDSFLSPQQLLGYPKAKKRKRKRQSRRRRNSMILTDTPQKKILNSYQSIRKVSKPPHKQVKNARRYLYSNRNLDQDKMPQLSDHSSEYLSDSSKTSETANFPELNKPPEVNDFVLIEFNTLPKKYYVGKITKPEDADKDYEISYMRKKHFSFKFFFPCIEDVASVNRNDIKVILPTPTECGTTCRKKSSLKFSYDFCFLNVF